MADENKPAFYPRVGRNIAKNFRSAQPPAFIEDPRAMELPQYGDIDLSVPSRENLEMARRMAERDAQLKRQQQADRSPLEKLAGGIQAGRFMGSALTQAVNSLPTRLFKGDEAADKFMQERIYKPEQPLAYEYAGDIGDFLEKLETEYKIPPVLPEAVALQYLSGPATAQAMKAAGKGALQAGMAVERGMEPVVRGALERGGLPREMAMAMGANTQSNVVKPRGGNWLAGSVEKVLDPLIQKGTINNINIPYGPDFDAAALKRIAELKEAASQPNYTGGAGRVAEHLERDINNPRRANEAAMNKWIQSNLTNYVKKDMGTPEDPVRRLAEEGVSHLPTDASTPLNMGAVRETRKEAGFPDPYGQSWRGMLWESKADKPIGFGTAGEMINRGKGEPWMEKVDPFTKVYGISPMDSVNFTQDLGFNHIVDVLRQDVAAGRIRPEQLSKVSMEQAVRRTYEYDQEMAKKMAETQAKITEGMPVVKEYPEGYKWIELTTPNKLPEGYTLQPNTGYNMNEYPYKVFSPEGKELYAAKNEADAAKDLAGNHQLLEDALKYEGNTMGHCVGGYCPDVLEGRSRIYSLRDAKGEPHVTVEVEPNQNPYPVSGEAFAMLPQATKAQYGQYVREWRQRNPNIENLTDEHTTQALKEAGVPPQPDRIVQIKGKGNAKPKDNYLPFVQDFVRGGKWSDVGDFRNTGLIRKSDLIDKFSPDELDAIGAGEYLTKGEHDDLLLKALRPPAGMKRGGKVSISNNPDTMMLELNNQKMKNGEPAYAGGKLVTSQAAKAAKAAKVPPPIRFPVTRGPSIPEIRAMAERMAPQVMGEFVRAAPTPSNPKPSTSVVGKTQKQFEREKTLPIEYENIKEPVTPEEFDYAKKKGALLIGAQGDVTPGNRMLVSIDEQPLSVPVHLQAGPEWELYNPSAWAATDQMAKTWMKRAGQAAEAYDADPYLHYHKMTPDANWYAMHHFNSVLGHLRPEELKLRDPKLYQQMIEEIRTKDVGFGKHPEFEGFDDPLNLQIHAQIDPNFRRHIGAIFGGPKFTERYGLNSGQDVLAATSLPELRDLEAGASGYAVVPLDVKAPLKNFEAESQTYDTGFPKAGPSGRSKYPSPYQLIYRDTLNWMKEHPSENKSSEFGRMNMIVPKQQIDNELIEAIGEYQRRMKELTGKKEGGYIKKPAAYIDGNEFVLAAQKYGLGDDINTLNKIVMLVNQGATVDDAARTVAGGVKKAAGGAISADDLIIEERPL